MADIETVSVISKDSTYHNGEPFTINKDDFDPQKYELANADSAVETAEGVEVGDDNKPKSRKAKS